MPSSTLLPLDFRQSVRNLLETYYNALTNHLKNEHKEYQSISKKMLESKREVSNERREKLEILESKYVILLSSTQCMSDLLNKPMPDLSNHIHQKKSLTCDQEKQVRNFLGGRDNQTVGFLNIFSFFAKAYVMLNIFFLHFFFFTQILIEKFGLTITKEDIQTLRPFKWLNDMVINFYMELLVERSKQNENLPKVYSMNTYFFKSLMERGYVAVQRWTRKVDIFAYDVILVPVNEDEIHWCLAAIDLKQESIKYYDSMGSLDGIVPYILRDYLLAESLNKKKKTLNMENWQMENVQNIPQQEFEGDCGVFMCVYSEMLSCNKPFSFTHEDVRYYRKKIIFEICNGKLFE